MDHIRACLLAIHHHLTVAGRNTTASSQNKPLFESITWKGAGLQDKMAVNTCCFRFVLFVTLQFCRFGEVHPSNHGAYCDGDPLGLLQQPLFVDLSNCDRICKNQT